ncbi:MAG: lysoplasmalogenase [Actinobacteria bacterium]|nr:lysoplasmalogenase [Actinomycetota bacterium]
MPAAALNDPAAVALGVAAVGAVANWWAVSVGRRRIEWVTKPGVMVALIVAAILVDPVDATVRAWVIAGLVFSLAGDVFLMLPRERFVEGLGSFLVAHVAYIVAFVLSATSWTGASVGAAAAIVALALVGRPIVSAVRRDRPALAWPVVAYMAVISSMVVAAFATARPWPIVGSLVFFASDGILATNKFVRSLPGARFSIMSTYHVAQFCFVVALVH